MCELFKLLGLVSSDFSPVTLLSSPSHSTSPTQAAPVPPIAHSPFIPVMSFLPFLCQKHTHLIPQDLTKMSGETCLDSSQSYLLFHATHHTPCPIASKALTPFYWGGVYICLPQQSLGPIHLCMLGSQNSSAWHLVGVPLVETGGLISFLKNLGK